jgi:hypothetical protein
MENGTFERIRYGQGGRAYKERRPCRPADRNGLRAWGGERSSTKGAVARIFEGQWAGGDNPLIIPISPRGGRAGKMVREHPAVGPAAGAKNLARPADAASRKKARDYPRCYGRAQNGAVALQRSRGGA